MNRQGPGKIETYGKALAEIVEMCDAKGHGSDCHLDIINAIERCAQGALGNAGLGPQQFPEGLKMEAE